MRTSRGGRTPAVQHVGWRAKTALNKPGAANAASAMEITGSFSDRSGELASDWSRERMQREGAVGLVGKV